VANTKSAKKAIRSSQRKYEHNLFWKRRIKAASKNVKKLLEEGANADILKENLSILQKVLDKASKKKVIHRNKANRLKSRFANKIAAHEPESNKTTTESKTTKLGSKSKAK
jgi:small subunit ribosomal protein S20